jgi:hypothetical protein
VGILNSGWKGNGLHSTVWMACIVLLESGVVPISNFCLDVQDMEFDVFYKFGQYIVVAYVYK